MATATNLVFNGVTLVNITGVGGHYAQAQRLPNETNFRPITLHNTAYRADRITGFAQTNETAETLVFNCITETASWAVSEALLAILAGFQQGGFAYTLGFATPIFNGTAQSYTNMKLVRFTMGAPVIQAPATGNWRVHFQVKFVRFGL